MKAGKVGFELIEFEQYFEQYFSHKMLWQFFWMANCYFYVGNPVINPVKYSTNQITE